MQEYEETVLYYSEISKDLAVAFIKCVESGIKKILEYPDAWQIVEEGYRRFLIKRFPFGIYYSIESEYIMIISVMHMNRKPGYWKNRAMVPNQENKMRKEYDFFKMKGHKNPYAKELKK